MIMYDANCVGFVSYIPTFSNILYFDFTAVIMFVPLNVRGISVVFVRNLWCIASQKELDLQKNKGQIQHTQYLACQLYVQA